MRAGASIEDVARALRWRPAALTTLVTAADPVAALLGHSYAEAGPDLPESRRARLGLGQMLLGKVAEQVFERLYKREIGSNELILEDSRDARNDTDYRVLNGQRRPVFRINIKFHGTQFRDAIKNVGLAPEDCFALATYKIWHGLQKEARESLPFVFLVVSVADLSADRVGALVPDDLARFGTLIKAARNVTDLPKRDIEERIVDLLLGGAIAEFEATRTEVEAKLEAADWRALSAARANRLLREMLFERVFAVRLPRFTQSYRRAEVDMHFSLSSDMTGLRDFLKVYKDGGLHLLTSKLARGEI